MTQPNNLLPQDQQDFLNRFQQQGLQALSPQEAQARYGQLPRRSSSSRRRTSSRT